MRLNIIHETHKSYFLTRVFSPKKYTEVNIYGEITLATELLKKLYFIIISVKNYVLV